MNISGEYETKDGELDIVKYFLNKENLNYKSLRKYDEADAGDVLVKFENNLELLFEIKEESIDRIKKYNQYGIDYISSCVFKHDYDIDQWRGLHNPSEFKDFFGTLDYKNKSFKWGKIKYSKSDIWLFYAKDYTTGKIVFVNIYNARKIKESDLLTYLQENCPFAVNNKSKEQKSFSDRHHSATFFIDVDKMDVFKMTKKDWIVYYK